MLGQWCLAGLAAYLLRSALHDLKPRSLVLITGSLMIFARLCYWLGDFASEGDLAPVFAFAQAILLSIIVLVVGIWMVWSLPGWRKAAALLMSIAFPVALFISINIGYERSPDAIIRRNGQAIVQALEQYHEKTGTYPKSLEELVPTYLNPLPTEPKTIWGWLYTSSDDDFTLGYVCDVGKLGYSVCVYTPEAREWDWLHNSTGPFTLEPTPAFARPATLDVTPTPDETKSASEATWTTVPFSATVGITATATELGIGELTTVTFKLYNAGQALFEKPYCSLVGHAPNDKLALFQVNQVRRVIMGKTEIFSSTGESLDLEIKFVRIMNPGEICRGEFLLRAIHSGMESLYVKCSGLKLDMRHSDGRVALNGTWTLVVSAPIEIQVYAPTPTP